MGIEWKKRSHLDSVRYNRYVCYHFGGSMKLNACILLLAHMVYL